MSQIRMPRREVSIPEEGSESDESFTLENVVPEPRRRPSRISFSKLWKFSALSVSPSPRVSTIDGPTGLYEQDSLGQLERIERRNVLICRVAFGVMLIVAIILTVLTVIFALKAGNIPYCDFDDNDFVTSRDYNDPEVFDDLTFQEYEAVIKYLLDYQSLGLVPHENATLMDSYIALIELYLPNKGETLQYFDEGSKQPERVAKVVIYRGSHDPPVVEELLVFPTYDPQEAVSFQDPSFGGRHIPFNIRPMDLIEEKTIHGNFLSSVSEDLYPLLIESYNLSYHNCTKGQNCIEFLGFAMKVNDIRRRQSLIKAFRSVDGYYIHPLELELLIDHTSTNVSEWTVELLTYNKNTFYSITSFMEAFTSGSLSMLHIHRRNTEYDLYSSLEAREPLTSEPKPGPFLFEPEGKRFNVKGQQVEYKSWVFRFHMHPTHGLMLFDIRFNAVRVAYEISLQDILVLDGNSSFGGYDNSRFLGSATTELVHGVDCPENAVYLSCDIWTRAGKVENIRNNICVFESNGAVPLRRHVSSARGSSSFYGGLVDYHLIVRTIVTLMNNDYVVDYIFYGNGAIESKVHVTGYILGSYRFDDVEDGIPIHDHVIANLHQHLFNFKVDLDIAGTNNRYSVQELIHNTYTDQASGKHSRLTTLMSSISKETRNTSSRLESTIGHFINNVNAKDAYGSDRAYKITNITPIPMQLGEQSSLPNWTKYPVTVTKRKDSEQRSASIYAVRESSDPVLDFDDYIDHESLLDEDLVTWITVGFTHLPGTEDVPGINANLNHASFVLSPHNYLAECPSVHSADNTVIRPREHTSGKTVVNTYGRSVDAKCVPKMHGPDGYV